jgi:hypothetical protein
MHAPACRSWNTYSMLIRELDFLYLRPVIDIIVVDPDLYPNFEIVRTLILLIKCFWRQNKCSGKHEVK